MKQKKEILLISHAFIKKINTSICEILASKYKFKVSIICPKILYEKSRIYPDYKKIRHIKKIYFLKTQFSHLRLMVYRKIYLVLKKNNFKHIILDSDPVSLQSFILIFYSFFFNFRVSYFSNENRILEKNKPIKKLIKIVFLKILHKIIKNKVYNIFCYTNQIKKNLEELGYKKNLIVAPLGYNNKIFFKKNTRSTNKFIISYFGRIEPEKGVHTLVKALTLINIKKFIFFLDVLHLNNMKYYRTITKDLEILKIRGQLRFIKPSYKNIANVMRKSYITVVPSEWNEQYGRVIQEASACGSLVIGSDVGAIPEIIFKKKFIFKNKNIIDLKNKIENIYYNKKKFKKEFAKIYKYIITNRSVFNQAKILQAHLS